MTLNKGKRGLVRESLINLLVSLGRAERTLEFPF